MFILRILIFFIMLLCLVSSGWAETTVKEGTKEIGHGLKTMGTETGQAIKDGGKEVGQGLKKIGKATGQAIDQKSRKVGREMKKAGQATGRQAKRTGQTVSDWCRDTYHKTVKTLARISNDIRDYFSGK